MFSRSVYSLILLLVLVACNKTEKGSSSRGTQKPLTPDVALTTDELVQKYKVFDPNYNFLKVSKSSFPYAQQTFPVLDGQQSTVAILQLDQLLAVRMRMLEQAKKSVRIQSLIFWADEVGWLIADKLVELKRRGIDVRVTIDSISNMGFATQGLFFHLEQNGIPVEGYEPLYLWPWVYGNGGTTFVEKYELANERYHEKLFIVDGEIPESAQAITGGVNVSNEYFRIDEADKFKMWRDHDVVVKGQAAIELTKMFDRNYNAMVELRKSVGRFDFDGMWVAVQALAKAMKKEELINVNRPKYDAKIQSKMAARAALPVELSWHLPEKLRILQNRPRMDEFYIEDAYIDMINSATREINIANAYIIPSDEMLAALIAAAKRGVTIRLVTNCPETSEFPMVSMASRVYYRDLLKVNEENIAGAGKIYIYEWLGDKIAKNGEGHFHAKYATFDREALVIGTYNFDPRSRNNNSENVVLMLDPYGADELSKIIEGDIDPSLARSISYAESLTFHEPADNFLDRLRQNLIPFVKPLL